MLRKGFYQSGGMFCRAELHLMGKNVIDTNTDAAWEEWGRRDPYFGVLTNSKFRRIGMTEETKFEFFESGRLHVEFVLQTIRSHIVSEFNPRTILDFGCGVGRTLVTFSKMAHQAVGVDVSDSMLKEARNNCQERGLSNVLLFLSDDDLSALSGTFNLIHSAIVFQHIPLDRGRHIVRGLLARLAPRGVGALHFLYSKSIYASTYGVAPAENIVVGAAPHPAPLGIDPEIQMNPYPMNEILFLLHTAGVQTFHAEFTDHGGELGVFVFFQLT